MDLNHGFFPYQRNVLTGLNYESVLPHEDLNFDFLIQGQTCCHCTMRHRVGDDGVEPPCLLGPKPSGTPPRPIPDKCARRDSNSRLRIKSPQH